MKQHARLAVAIAIAAALLVSGDAAARRSPAPDVLVGAGEIATCNSDNDELTAKRIDAVDGTVFTLGNNAWSRGTLDEFEDCYEPTWGRHRDRTRAAVGERDFLTPRAAGLFAYFDGTTAVPPPGWYSYDTAGWHVVVLNSALPITRQSPQLEWFENDLTAHPNECTIAMWSHPRFSSGRAAPGFAKTAPFFDTAYAAGVDVVLNAREAWYERFAPIDPTGAADPSGIRQFVVGTGGIALQAPEPGTPIQPASEFRSADSRGVLELRLDEGAYEWQFLPVAGEPLNDVGRGACHAGRRDLPLAYDPFERTRADGWGNAQIGGPWTSTNKRDFTTDGSVAQVRLSRDLNAAGARLERISTTAVQVQSIMGVDREPLGLGYFSNVVVRRVSPGNEYRAQLRRRPDGSVTLSLSRVVNRVATRLVDETVIPGVEATDDIRVVAEISGQSPTSLRARATAVDDHESTNWLLSATDRTDVLQHAGTIGWSAFIERPPVAGRAVRFTIDEFRAVPIEPIPELPLAHDTFARAASDGWGIAEAGGPWTTGNPDTFSIVDDRGAARLARGQHRTIRLTNVRVFTANVAATLSSDKISRGTDQLTSIVVRRVSERNEYRVRIRRRVDGRIALAITRVIDGDETLLTREVLVTGARTVKAVRVVAQVRGRGPTTVRARAFSVDGVDPLRWMLSATDRTPSHQVAGTIGWAGHIERKARDAPVTFFVDDFIAAIPPPIQP